MTWSAEINVDLGRPESGWIRFAISHGDQVFSTVASNTPYDSVAALTQAVVEVAKGSDEVTVPLVEEPCEAELQFRKAGDCMCLSVTAYPDHRRMAGIGRRGLELRKPCLGICLAFWRALRRLEAEVSSPDFERAWGHPFPTEKLTELTQLMQRMKADGPGWQAGGA